MSNIISVCPGCGVRLNSMNNLQEKDFNASSACRELYYQLSYYTLSLQDEDFIHQLIVDTYAAQHYGKNMKPMTITFALIGLYLVNEKDYSGKKVQLIHMKLANKAKNWPSFFLPKQKAHLTVKEVFEKKDDKKQEMIRNWCKDVWKIWKPEENMIASILQKYLDY